jgi:hypothetical protein
MRRCWLLVITNGLRVWIPPELYLESRMANREARRWILTLSRRRPPADPLRAAPIKLRANMLLHVIETDFVEPWRACPLWVGVRWSERSHPRLSSELMAADAEEATSWIRSHARSALDPGSDPELRFETTFIRRGATCTSPPIE